MMAFQQTLDNDDEIHSMATAKASNLSELPRVTFSPPMSTEPSQNDGKFETSSLRLDGTYSIEPDGYLRMIISGPREHFTHETFAAIYLIFQVTELGNTIRNNINRLRSIPVGRIGDILDAINAILEAPVPAAIGDGELGTSLN